MLKSRITINLLGFLISHAAIAVAFAFLPKSPAFTVIVVLLWAIALLAAVLLRK